MTEYVTIVIHVPIEYTQAVQAAMCDAGAGTVDDGHYDRVTYVTQCVGRYRVLDKAWDKAGASGEEYETNVSRIETICRKERIETVIQAIVKAHPYETPAIAISILH
ncbi:MAG: hypothetical protein GY832_02540 [Chloroflexi bacterium]|nr:hypothetical protein [Chloroflexota bacterium]